MSVLGGRGGRQDDWSTQHARARARASERLDGPIDPAEERWLDEHLATCAECDATAADYASQRLELRALLDKPITPPRDLWARTAAAIELEARHRSLQTTSRSRQSILAPYALLAGVLIVAVVVGRLSSSQLPGQVTTSPGVSASQQAFATDRPSSAPTPVLVPSKQVAYISIGTDGQYQWNNTRVNEVCPESADACATTNPDESHNIGPLPSPESVFGTATGPLVIVGGGDDTTGSKVLVVMVPDKSPAPDSTPSLALPTPTPTDTASATPTPTVEPTATPSLDVSPPPSVEPTQPAGTVEIARDVEVVDTTAAYAPDGSAFAFTARPSDGSHGSDIYVWHIGDAQAVPITTDHNSVFGSWAGTTIVGSSVKTNGNGAAVPVAFMYADSKTTKLPESRAWRPVIDPTQGSAVYWTGSLKQTADGLGWETVSGRLVLGRWEVQGAPAASDAPTKSQGASHAATANETTIQTGPIADWDARWDETGTRLAVWIANADDPSVGRLSLYVVDPSDGRIDASASPLVDEPALSGFSITDGRLAWAVPPDSSDPTSRVSILAWTAEGFGQVETAPGDFILVR